MSLEPVEASQRSYCCRARNEFLAEQRAKGPRQDGADGGRLVGVRVQDIQHPGDECGQPVISAKLDCLPLSPAGGPHSYSLG